MSNKPKTIADSISLLRKNKPISGADRLNICRFIDSLTETNIRQAAAIQDLLEKPENQRAVREAQGLLIQLRHVVQKRDEALELYDQLVDACIEHVPAETRQTLGTELSDVRLYHGTDYTEDAELPSEPLRGEYWPTVEDYQL